MDERFANPTDWQDRVIGAPWGYDRGFRIHTSTPSEVVRKAIRERFIRPRDRVVDLGSGKSLRNAIYLAANFNCLVDAIDLEPPETPLDTPEVVLKCIHFTQCSVLNYEYIEGTYQAAILARLIQYLSPEDLRLLIQQISRSLVPKGLMLLSYTAQGGILSRGGGYGVETFVHPIEKVRSVLENSGLSIITLDNGVPRSTYVPHQGEPALTYDIIARKVLYP